MADQPTTSRLRYDIDRGRAGDKVDVMDPAAAPLGTDEEAAGTPPSARAVAMAYAQEVGSAPISSERTNGDHAVAIYLSAIIVIGDLHPSGPLRIVAGFESLNGLVLIGWSASFTYLTMEEFWGSKRSRSTST